MNNYFFTITIRYFLALLFTGFSPYMSFMADGQILTDDGYIHIEQSGQGKTLVFLGGGGMMDLRQWRDQSNYFKNNFHCVLIDPRGIGGSDLPTKPFNNAEELKFVLDVLDVKQAVIIGLSYAGGIALDFSILYPNYVSGLIVMGPLINGWEFSEGMIKKQVLLMEAAEKGVEEFIRIAFEEDTYFMPSPKNKSGRERAKKLIRESFESPGFDQSFIQVLSPATSTRVNEISCPTLLLAGALDHADIHKRIDFLAREISSSTKKLIQDAGHIVNMENPKELNLAIAQFLRKL